VNIYFFIRNRYLFRSK